MAIPRTGSRRGGAAVLAAVVVSILILPAGPALAADVMCGGKVATVTGTSGDDELTGTPGDDVMHGLAGDDRISGGGGDDTICGGTGDDALYGDEGKDVLRGQEGAFNLLQGGPGNDVLDDHGYDTSNRMVGDAGDDRLLGGSNDDVMEGGTGFDTMRPGGGNNTIVYKESDGNVVVDLEANTAQTPDGTETVAGFRNVRAGDGITAYGTNDSNILLGVPGSTLYGRGGNDHFGGGGMWFGHAGNDKMFVERPGTVARGGTGRDYLRGSEYADTLIGGSGKDTIAPAEGDDQVDGGPGVDWLKYRDDFHAQLAGGFTIDLAAGTATAHNPANTGGGVPTDPPAYEQDTVLNIENVEGSGAADVIRGNDADNYIHGREANDEIRGRGGNDTLIGGGGTDSVYGGHGTDSCEGETKVGCE